MTTNTRVLSWAAAMLLATTSVAAACSADADSGPSRGNSTEVTEQVYAAQVTVDDPDAVGAVGDEQMSLAEAIRLANGTLETDELSEAELALVDGTPGATNADDIIFAVDGGRIEAPAQEVPAGMEWEPVVAESDLPTLAGNDGDRLSGGGVRLVNGPDDGPIGGLALRLSSSDLTITGITFERFAEMVAVQPADGAGISGVQIRDNRLLDGGGLSVTATTSDGAKSTVRDLTIVDNELLGPPEFGGTFPRSIHSGIGVTAATMASERSDGTATIGDVVIADNVIKGFMGGITMAGLQSFTGNSGAELTGVHIEGNEVVMPPAAGDPAIYVWGVVNLGGEASDVRISDLSINDNSIEGSGYIVLVTGVEHVYGQGLRTDGVDVRDVELIGNHIRPVGDCGIGMLVTAAFTEMSSGEATGTVMDDVELRDNDIDGCEVGAFVSPLLNWGAAGTSSDNSMTGVAIRDNHISGASTGLFVAGGVVMANGIGYQDAPDAGAEANTLKDLTITGNQHADTELGLQIAGGAALGAPGRVTGNEVDLADIAHGNGAGTTEACRITPNLVVESTATVAQNRVHGTRC